MKYSDEQQDGFKMQINTMLVLNPKLSIRQIAQAMKEQGEPLDKDYVHKLIKQLNEERTERFATQGKHETLAMMEDLATWVISQLRSIIREEANVYKGKDRSIEAKIISQANRIKALEAIFKIAEKVLNMKKGF